MLCMVPEIWTLSRADFFDFCHFGLFFALLSPPYPQRPPLPAKKEENNFEKMKKLAGDIIILQMYTCVP